MQRLGRYEILAELGRGAMGTVYRAHDPKIDRVVALKTITIAAAIAGVDEAEFRQRFFREAQAAGKLSHSGIVTIHDVGEDEATHTPYIVMEFIEGTTLEELARGERLPLPTALGLVEQVAEALDYAHRMRIIHRDIKPANIIVTPDGRAKITDFGVAKLQQVQFTQPGQVLGTPAYMSPEQLTGSAVDGRTDLFSLGVVLYWLLTGDKPFPGDTTSAVTFKIVYKDPLRPSELQPALSADHDYVVLRALAKDCGQRYQTGRDLADDLEDLNNGRAPRSRATPGAAMPPAAAYERTVVVPSGGVRPAPTPTTPTQPLPSSPLVAQAPTMVLPPAKKRRWLVPPSVAALAVLLLAGSWWWWSSGDQEASEPPAEREATAAPTQPTPKKKEEPPPWAPARGARRSQPEEQSRVAEPRTRAVATLRLAGEHNFERATLYVYVDDQLLKRATVSGEAVRQKGVTLGLGRISETVSISPGRHTITIRIQAPRDDFDQTKYITGEFDSGQTRTLEISFGKLGKWVGIGELTRDLTLRWTD